MSKAEDINVSKWDYQIDYNKEETIDFFTNENQSEDKVLETAKKYIQSFNIN